MHTFNALALTILMAMLLSPLVKATSIQSLDFETVTKSSEFIFEGTVIKTEARWNASKSLIHTYITFEIDEILKGQFSDAQVELRFAGGSIDDQSFVYQGMVYPQLGEHGIYFVETLNKNLVNPLVGWSQGHYKMANGKVTTNESKPVLAIQASLKVNAGELSEGAPAGMRLGKEGQLGMSDAEFKKRIKALTN